MPTLRWIAFALCATGCGPTVAVGGDDASGGSTTAPPEGSTTGTVTTLQPSGTVSTDAVTSDAESSSTGFPPACDVQAGEPRMLSGGRFGTLTVPVGDPDHIVLGAQGWRLVGALDNPDDVLLLEPLDEMVVGRFGIGGQWAFGHFAEGVVDVVPLDGVDLPIMTTLDGPGRLVAGDMDGDGLDDLIATHEQRVQVWRADGRGRFERLAESEPQSPEGLTGYAPASPSSPASVLVSGDGVVIGLEVEEASLVHRFDLELPSAYFVQGVEPNPGASHTLLVSTWYVQLSLHHTVGFVDHVDDAWVGRGLDVEVETIVEPRPVDLDGDGVLDVIYAEPDAGLLRGACSRGEGLEPCLEVSLPGSPESVAVTEHAGVSWALVATQNDGLWAYPLGDCV